MPTITKILVDTNIFIYAYDTSSIFHQKAVEFLSNDELALCTSTKNVAEFFAVLSKIGQPFVKAYTFYLDIKSNVDLLFPSEGSLSIFEILLQKYQPKGNLVFDLEIVSIALENQVSEIATVNAKDLEGISEITVLAI